MGYSQRWYFIHEKRFYACLIIFRGRGGEGKGTQFHGLVFSLARRRGHFPVTVCAVPVVPWPGISRARILVYTCNTLDRYVERLRKFLQTFSRKYRTSVFEISRMEEFSRGWLSGTSFPVPVKILTHGTGL